MPSFNVEHETKLSRAEVFTKVQEYFSNSQSLRKLDSGIECHFDQATGTGKVKGSKFECDVKIQGDSPTKVVLQISIGFLLSPFKGKIQETLKEKMTRLLG